MIWYAYCSTEDRNGPAPWKPLFSVRLPVRLERTLLLSRQDFQEESTKRFVSLFFGSGKLVFIGTFWTSRPEHFQTFSDTMSCLSYFRKLHTSPKQTVLGNPCAAPGSWVSLTFRGLCFGYFICTLLPYLWGPGTLSRYFLCMCFVCNSLGAFLCSYSWCGGNIELLAVILWTLFFKHFVSWFLSRPMWYIMFSSPQWAALSSAWWALRALRRRPRTGIPNGGHSVSSSWGQYGWLGFFAPGTGASFSYKDAGTVFVHDCFDNLK